MADNWYQDSPVVDAPSAPAAPRPVARGSAAAQALGGSTQAEPMPKAPPAPQATGMGAGIPPAAPGGVGTPPQGDASAWWEAAPVVQTTPPAAPQRQVGMLETMGRTAAAAAIPVVRSIDMAAASMAGMLAPLLGMNAQEEQAKIFRDSDARVARMHQEYAPKADEQFSRPGQIAGGVLAAPIEMTGGMGLQHGIDTSAEVLQRGGTGKQAAVAGGVSGGVHAALNLLPVKAGGAVGRAVESVVAKGIGQKVAPVAAGALTGGAISAAGDVAGTAAENAALPEGNEFASMRQEANPALSFGMGAAFGGAAAHGQNRGGRKAAKEAGEPVSAVEAGLASTEKAPSIDPETMRLAQKARAYGIPLRPDMLTDSKIAKYVGDVLEKVPLGGSKAPERQKAFNRAVMDQLGADPKADALTPDVFDAALTKAGKEIGDISARTSVPFEALAKVERVARRETPDVQKVIEVYANDLQKIAEANGGIIPGEQLRKLRTEAATQARGSSNGDLRRTLGAFVDHLDDAIEKHAPEGDTEALADARRRYAIGITLEPLVAKSTTGDISPAALMGRVTSDRAGKSRMARGRGGELGDLARIGQKFLKEPPSSGTAERLAAGGAVAGVGTGALVAPGAAATAAGAIGAANLYNRLGPKLVERKLAKAAAPAERVEPGPLEPDAAAAATPTSAVQPGGATDPRLAEIARLREGASPETLKVLDEHEKAVQKDIKAQEVKAERDAEALKLEATAAKTTDPGIKAALIDRANKLRSEKIPAGEAQELTSIPIETTKHGPIPAGKATELSEVPGPKVSEPKKPLPVGAAREVTVIDQQPAAPIEPTQIPAGEATELPLEQVEPAPRPAEPPRSAAGSDTEAELTLLQPGAPARGQKLSGPVSSVAPDAKPASWVIREKGTGKVIMETFDPKKVAALNTQKYEAVPIGEYLGSINKPEKRGGDLKKGGQVPKAPFKQRAELENALRAKLGHKLVDGLLKRNVISLGEAPADVPRDAQGRFTGSVVELYHDRLDAQTAPAVLMHEVGEHYGMEKMLGAERYAELLDDVRKMKQRPEVAKAWQAVLDNYPLKEDSPEFVSEVAAHLVETAPDRPIVRRMLDAPRAYLYKNFGVNIGRADPGLVQALAAGALRKSAGVEAVSPNPAALATAGARQEEEPAAQ